MHVLVTGANAFIGRHAAAALSAAGLRVTGTYRSNGPAVDRLRAVAPEVALVQLDLAREAAYAALPTTVDSIVHIAGVSAMPGVTIDDMRACNVTGAHNLVSYAGRAKASCLVFASTLSVHGDVNDGVVTETTPIRSPDTYGASKYLAERIFAAESSWLPCVALRLPGVLGEGAHRAWIPTLLQRIRNHEDVEFHSPRSPFNNAAHVDDLGGLMLKLVEAGWSGFHACPVAAAGQMVIADVVGLLMSLTGSRSKLTERSAQKPPFTVSSDYAVRHFGYRPTDIEVMLRRYVSQAPGACTLRR